MSEIAALIQAYAAEPVGQGVLESHDFFYQQENSICGDNICIYGKLSDDQQTLVAFSHGGSPQMFTLAAASMLAEQVEGHSVNDILQRGASFMESLGLTVSPRRKRSTVSALLALHNGLVAHTGRGVAWDYETILDQ